MQPSNTQGKASWQGCERAMSPPPTLESILTFKVQGSTKVRAIVPSLTLRVLGKLFP